MYLEKTNLMRLSNEVVLFDQNEVLFFISGRQSDILSCNGPGRYLLTISQKLLCQFIQLLEMDIFKVPVPVDIPSYIALPCPEGSVTREVVRELCVSGDNNDAAIPSARKQLLLMTLLSYFLENRFFLPLLKGLLRKTMTKQVMIIVTSDISDNWSTEKVAARLCVSPSLLKKRLKDENTSYSQVVLECRMQKARELLGLQRLPVKQVAGLCGYRSVSYFIAVFRRYYGCTPCEYDSMNTEK